MRACGSGSSWAPRWAPRRPPRPVERPEQGSRRRRQRRREPRPRVGARPWTCVPSTSSPVGERSLEAAICAAGAGLGAIEALDAGVSDCAFLAVRPPGHHAVPAHAMGFCLLNNIAITAAELVARGERVLIVDWDAHHGNGT